MESWCFDCVDKGYLSNETVSPCPSITKTKNASMGWEFKDPFNCESGMLILSQQNVGNPGYPEMGFEEVLRTQLPPHSGRDVLFNMNGSVEGTVSTTVVTSNAISGVDESSLKLSGSVMDSESRESSIIDLKLGGFGNRPTPNTSGANPISSSSEPPAKRARVTNLSSQTAYCQVYGCNKELSSAKDYYKRHRVCEAHSKTAKVIVKGIEQRFCQQCSRFHLVAEFDNGKRSCRKRLAGHNERRRKPQAGFNTSRAGRSLHFSAGSEGTWFHGSTLTLTSASTSFICQETNGFPSIQNHRRDDWGTHMKVEDRTNCVQKSDNTCINGQLDQKSVWVSSLSREEHPSLPNKRNNPRLGSDFREDIEQNAQLIVSNSLSHNEDSMLFDAASTIQALTGTSNSGRALSLLSSQSPVSSSPPYYYSIE